MAAREEKRQFFSLNLFVSSVYKAYSTKGVIALFIGMVVPSIEAHCDNDTLLSARFWLVVESRGSQRGEPQPFSEQRKQVRFQQTHNQGLRWLLVMVSWDLGF